ncbi:MAG: radical SAM protein [Myxococcota bacterium]
MKRTVVRLELAERSAQNARYLVHLEDEGRVEAVVYRQDTVCLSTQVGCAVACPFCASGQNGLSRNLTFEEMRDTLDALLSDHALKRVTLSGVGEPLHNPASVAMLDECRRRDLGLSLTTSGGPLRRLEAWLRRPHRGLTISVHAGTEAVRRKAVPKGPALEPLFQCLAATLPALSRQRQKKTALAYLLVRGLNDGRDELEAFVTRVSALPVQPAVHLYALSRA